jgi:hypothetical protein
MSSKLESSPLLKTPPKSSEMSPAILLQNIQRIVEENEELRADMLNKREQIARLQQKHEK